MRQHKQAAELLDQTRRALYRILAGDDEVSTAAIDVRGLVKRYGEVEAVRGVEFSVATGEVFGFLGPNGAGKTTTINMLCTLTQADRRRGDASPATTSSASATTSGATSASCSRTRRSTAT